MNKLTLTHEDLDKFKAIHSLILPKRVKNYEHHMILNSTSSKNKQSLLIIQPIVSKSLEIFKQLGIHNIDDTTFGVEFHQLNSGFGKEKQISPFTWHIDDNAVVSYKVYTIIYYLRKDITIKGGDFQYEINDIELKHIVCSGDVLCFKGDISHIPEPSSGFGCRDIICVFIKRTQ